MVKYIATWYALSECDPLTAALLVCRAAAHHSGQLCHVRFSFDRTPLRRMHAALTAASALPGFAVLRAPAPGKASASAPQTNGKTRPFTSASDAPTVEPNRQAACRAGPGFQDVDRLPSQSMLEDAISPSITTHQPAPVPIYEQPQNGSRITPSPLSTGATQFQQQPTAAAVKAVEGTMAHVGAQRLNEEQRWAVAAVLAGAGAATPFALFGPPGTGKTVTLVECALQVRDQLRHR